MKRYSVFLFLLLTFLFTIPAVFAFFYHPFFTFHDETQIVNMYEFFKTLDLGQFPPRWGLDFHFNYGSPFLQFYYQTPYYLGYLFHLLGVSLVDTFQYLLILSFFVGALGMYFLGLQITSPLWAFIAAVVYTYTPYRAVASYVRGSLGESLSLALFPWVFLFSYQLYKKPTFPKAILVGFSWAILILTHQLATIFFLPLIFLPALFFLYSNRQLIFYLFVSLITSFGLSAYYLLPVLFEKKYIIPDGAFNFYDHFPFLKQLIFSKWGYRASLWGIDDGLSFQLGLIPWIILFTCLFLSFKILKTKVETTTKFTFFYLLFAFLGTIFLMNIRSSFIWESLNLAQYVQFPWRLLMITTFLIPTFFLFITPQIPQRFTIPFALFLLFSAPILTIGYFQPGEIYDRNDDYYLHRFLPNIAPQDQATISAQYLTHTEDYVSLPLNAVRPKELPQAKLTAQNETTKILVKSDHPFNLTYQLNTPENDLLTFHTFDFPGWQVKLGNKIIDHTTNDLGAITFAVPNGEHTLTISFVETPLRQISNLISITTLLGIIFLLIQNYRHQHRN